MYFGKEYVKGIKEEDFNKAFELMEDYLSDTRKYFNNYSDKLECSVKLLRLKIDLENNIKNIEEYENQFIEDKSNTEKSLNNSYNIVLENAKKYKGQFIENKNKAEEFLNKVYNDIFEQKIELRRSDSRFLSELGDLYWYDGDYKKAEKCFEKSATLGNYDALIKLGDLYFYRSKHNKDILKHNKDILRKTINCYKNVAKFDGYSVLNRLIRLGRSLYRRKIYNESFECCKEAIRIKPKSKEAWKYLKKVCIELKNIYDNCYKIDFKKNILPKNGLKEKYSNILYELGNCYKIEKNDEKAKEYFMLAVRLGHLEALDNLEKLYRDGQITAIQIIKLYRREAYRQGTDSTVISNKLADIGHLCISNGDYTYALECFVKAVEINPNNKTAEKQLKNIVDKFIKEKNEIKDHVILKNLGKLYYYGICVKKNHKKAVKYFKRLATLGYDKNKIRLNNLLSFYIKNRDYEGVMECCLAILELNSKNEEILNYLTDLGYLFFKRKNYAKALKCYKEVLKNNPENIEIKIRLDRVYELCFKQDNNIKFASETLNDLGCLYFRFIEKQGSEVANGKEQDRERAEKCFEIAAKKGNRKGKRMAKINLEKLKNLESPVSYYSSKSRKSQKEDSELKTLTFNDLYSATTNINEYSVSSQLQSDTTSSYIS